MNGLLGGRCEDVAEGSRPYRQAAGGQGPPVPAPGRRRRPVRAGEYRELIKAFQADQGLTRDGLLGRKTWDAAYRNPIR